MSDVAPIRGKRPTAEESDLALIRAALHQQGILIAEIHSAVAKLIVRVEEIVTMLLEVR